MRGSHSNSRNFIQREAGSEQVQYSWCRATYQLTFICKGLPSEKSLSYVRLFGWQVAQSA